MYEILLIIHILAVTVWVGGGVALNFIATRTPPADRQAVLPQISFYGERVLTGASVVVILAGLGLVAELDLSITEPWILMGLGIFVASSVIGGALIGPTAGRMVDAISADPPDLGLADSLYSRIMLLSRLDILLLVGAVIVMVTKPGA